MEQNDSKNFIHRHPLLWGCIFGLLLIITVMGLAAAGARQTMNTAQNVPTMPPQATLMAQNNPTLKALGTFPTNYIGKTFTLNVYLQAERYYNFGFDDESKWYSVKLYDMSVGGPFDAVYAYLPKTPANKALVDQALSDAVFVQVTATVPADKWEDSSNAFLEITSWTY